MDVNVYTVEAARPAALKSLHSTNPRKKQRHLALLVCFVLVCQIILSACDSTTATSTVAATATALPVEPTATVQAVATVTTAPPTATETAPASATSTVSPGLPAATIRGKFEANGKQLFISCVGAGSPTIILDAGNGDRGARLSSMANKLAAHYAACWYDRANMGESGPAPTPRTAQDMVDDLHALLASAKIQGPYLFIGQSEGSLFAELYAREFPDQVVGIVSMNPVTPAHPWLEEAAKIFTEEEIAGEHAFFSGDNDESINFISSTLQLEAAGPPPDLPFEMLISTSSCDLDPVCVKAFPLYEQIEREVAASWPRGKYSEVDTGYEIYITRPEEVQAAVERIIGSAKN